MPRFCSYHADFDGICERNHISITNPCLFWPIPSILGSQTERNSQGYHSNGVVKKIVRFGSGREKKIYIFNISKNGRKLITLANRLLGGECYLLFKTEPANWGAKSTFHLFGINTTELENN